jgi:hypothetical protein
MVAVLFGSKNKTAILPYPSVQSYVVQPDYTHHQSKPTYQRIKGTGA